MDRLLEYYLFNNSDQLKLELKHVDGENERKLTISDQSSKDNRPSTTNQSLKRLNFNEFNGQPQIKYRSKISHPHKSDENQQTQTLTPQSHSKQLGMYEARNINTAVDYKANGIKNQSQSYSQTLRNYKWIQSLPSNSTINNNLNIETQTPVQMGQRQNFYNTPNNGGNKEPQGAASYSRRLSNSAVFSQSNGQYTPHQRVLRIKNKQINIQVQRHFNNLILDNNNFFDINLEEYYRQMDQVKNTKATMNEDMETPNLINYSEQQIKNIEGQSKSRTDQNKIDHINLYLNQKTPESLYTSAPTPINDLIIESPIPKVAMNNVGNDRYETSSSPKPSLNQIEHYQVQELSPNLQYNQKMNQSSKEEEKQKNEARDSRKSSGIQYTISQRMSKRGSHLNGRIVSPIVYNPENIEKSPMSQNKDTHLKAYNNHQFEKIKSQDGTWSHSFYKHTTGVHKQMKQVYKREKPLAHAHDFEEYLKQEIATQIPNVEKLDLANINPATPQTKDIIDSYATPQNLIYNLHRQKEGYKPLQISKAFREQYKNISQLLYYDQDVVSTSTPQSSYQPQRNKSQSSQQKAKPENPRPSVSNISNRIHVNKHHNQSMAQTFYSKQSNEEMNHDAKRETFSSIFPTQKQNQEFRFSKCNFKRKNPSPKKNIFKI